MRVKGLVPLGYRARHIVTGYKKDDHLTPFKETFIEKPMGEVSNS